MARSEQTNSPHLSDELLAKGLELACARDEASPNGLEPFRVALPVMDLDMTISGHLPATEWRPMGGIRIEGLRDPRDAMYPEEARALATALLAVIDAMEEEASRRYPR